MRVTPGGVAELALQGGTATEFRRAVVSALIDDVGAECGLFHAVGRDVPIDASALVNLDRGIVEGIQSNWARYVVEVAPVLAGMVRERAVVDVDVLGRERHASLAFTRELVRPRGLGASLYCHIPVPDRDPWVLVLSRGLGDRSFRAGDVARVRRLIPYIALGNAALRNGGAARPRIELSPREQRMVEQLRLGYTNAQIAEALGLSPYTVRNCLSDIYERAGVQNRAGLLGLLQPR